MKITHLHTHIVISQSPVCCTFSKNSQMSMRFEYVIETPACFLFKVIDAVKVFLSLEVVLEKLKFV